MGMPPTEKLFTVASLGCTKPPASGLQAGGGEAPGERRACHLDDLEVTLALILQALPELRQPEPVARDEELGLQLQCGLEVRECAIRLALAQIDQAAIAHGHGGRGL